MTYLEKLLLKELGHATSSLEQCKRSVADQEKTLDKVRQTQEYQETKIRFLTEYLTKHFGSVKGLSESTDYCSDLAMLFPEV